MARRKMDTPEEQAKARRAFDISEKMREAKYLPEPTYVFKVGDYVERGNLQDVKVIEVFEGGKFYELDYTSVDTNYGNPVTNRHRRGFATWLDIRPLVENVDHDIIKNEDLRLHYAQTALMTFLGKLYYFRVDMTPEYQRGYVWEPDDNVHLIDSIFKNISIGTFVFVHNPFQEGKPAYEILDGKQRLEAIGKYYENRFPYKGLFYNDLSRQEKNHFVNFSVSYAEIQNVTRQQKLRYFFMLNRAGKVMDEAHLRKIEAMIIGEEL